MWGTVVTLELLQYILNPKTRVWVMGVFGRSPPCSTLMQMYISPGEDSWSFPKLEATSVEHMSWFAFGNYFWFGGQALTSPQQPTAIACPPHCATSTLPLLKPQPPKPHDDGSCLNNFRAAEQATFLKQTGRYHWRGLRTPNPNTCISVYA